MSGLSLVAALGLSATVAAGPWDDLPDGGREFKTFFVTWTDNGSEAMFDYLRRARPEVVQVGFYGPMFHGYAHHPKSTGYPMQLPISGERAALERQTEINRRIHELLPGARVIGHFQLCNVVENPDEPFGFIKWYNELWDQDLLGPKPVEDVRELLQRDAEGNILKGGGYIDFIGLCVSSPHTRALLKKMVDVAIDAGVDGLVSNYNYRWGCVCAHCQASFKEYLRQRYDAAALKEQFGVEDLEAHRFAQIPAKIPGYPKEFDEFHRAAMTWGATQFKRAFDEIYLEHGRSRQPGLIVGTWNHLGTVRETEERAFLPSALWGRGEDYFWYSGSHAGKKLSEGEAGDAWLNLLWLRAMTGGKPMMIGKYEQVRLRAALAEAAALGGAGTGLYHPFTDPYGAEVMATYLNFIHEHRAFYRGVRPYAEVALVLPRQSVLAGDPAPLESFRQLGRKLCESRTLFDVVLDERLDAERVRGYHAVLVPDGALLTAAQQALAREAGAPLSRISGPWTLRASAFDHADGRLLHLVNYHRDEAAAEGRRGPTAELPIAQRDIEVSLLTLRPVASVTLWSPDHDPPRKSIELPFTQTDGRMDFTVPEVMVYAVVDVRWH